MKFGIKYGYPNVEEINKKLSSYIQLIRPMTLLAPFLVGITGILLERVYNHGTFNIWIVIYAALTLTLLQAVGQITNQATDVAVDKWNKAYRPIPSGKITINEAYALAAILAVFALGRAFTINLRFFILCSLLLVFALGYSLEPIRMKRRHPIIILLWLAISRGLLPILAMWSVFSNTFSKLTMVVGTFSFLWVLSYQCTKDFSDKFGDKEFNYPTLITKYGEIETLWYMFISTFLIYAFLGYNILTGLISSNFVILNLLLFVSFGILFGVEKESFMENNVGWFLFYIGLGLIPVISLIALLI